MSLISTSDDLKNRIKYHRPTEEGISRIAANRKAALAFADTVLSSCPEGRDKEISLTKIEEALFWANAAIARDSAFTASDESD